MVGHEQSGHDLTLHDMPFHDLGHIGLRADPIPDSLRVDDHAGSHLAMVEAAGLVCADDSFEVQPFRFILEMGVELFRAQIGAAAARIVFGALVGADKDMTLKWRHGLGRHRGRVEAFHQEPHVLSCEQRRWFLRGVQNGHDLPQPNGCAEKLVALGEFGSLAGA